MSTQQLNIWPLTSLLRLGWSWFRADWFSIVQTLARLVRYSFSAQRRQGLYEILDYKATLELLDPKGAAAIFRKRQKVKFLQNNIIAFEDYAWGDGDTLAGYSCSPGVVVDRYQEGDRWNLLISLRETKNRGDVMEFHIERRVKDGFVQSDEWQQAEIRNRTHRLQMTVIFPKDRHCRRATMKQRSRNQVLVLGPEYFHPLPDGRQRVSWETRDAREYDIYTLNWEW